MGDRSRYGGGEPERPYLRKRDKMIKVNFTSERISFLSKGHCFSVHDTFLGDSKSAVSA